MVEVSLGDLQVALYMRVAVEHQARSDKLDQTPENGKTPVSPIVGIMDEARWRMGLQNIQSMSSYQATDKHARQPANKSRPHLQLSILVSPNSFLAAAAAKAGHPQARDSLYLAIQGDPSLDFKIIAIVISGNIG
jgi:hypothetical protein